MIKLLLRIITRRNFVVERKGPHDEDWQMIGTRTLSKRDACDFMLIMINTRSSRDSTRYRMRKLNG